MATVPLSMVNRASSFRGALSWSDFNVLQNDLPTELFDAVLSYLSRSDLCKISRVSRRFYEPAVSFIYHEIRLVDRHNPEVHDDLDDHDDSDIISVLMTFCKWVLALSSICWILMLRMAGQETIPCVESNRAILWLSNSSTGHFCFSAIRII